MSTAIQPSTENPDVLADPAVARRLLELALDHGPSLEKLSAGEIIEWGAEHLGTNLAVTMSMQDTVLAELAARHAPDADLIFLDGEKFDENQDMIIFDPIETWKKTKLKAGTYTLRELLVKVIDKGEPCYTSPSVMEIQKICKQEQETLWDETRRLVNPHEVYVDLSEKLYKIKSELLEEMSMKHLQR